MLHSLMDERTRKLFWHYYAQVDISSLSDSAKLEWAKYFTPKVLELKNGDGLYTYPVINKIGGTPGYLTTCFLDDLINPAEFLTDDILPDGYSMTDMGCPILYYDLTASSFEDYQSKAKVGNKYKVGNRFERLDIQLVETSIAGYLYSNPTIIEAKHSRFPDANFDLAINNCNFVDRVSNSTKSYAIIAYDKEEYKHAFTLLLSETSKGLNGYFVHVSEDPELRKLHSLYVVAHLEGVRLGYYLNKQHVNFGMYFDYKSIFGIEPTFYAGIRTETPKLSDEVIKFKLESVRT